MALNIGAWQLYDTTNHLNIGAWQGYYEEPEPPVPTVVAVRRVVQSHVTINTGIAISTFIMFFINIRKLLKLLFHCRECF